MLKYCNSTKGAEMLVCALYEVASKEYLKAKVYGQKEKERINVDFLTGDFFSVCEGYGREIMRKIDRETENAEEMIKRFAESSEIAMKIPPGVWTEPWRVISKKYGLSCKVENYRLANEYISIKKPTKKARKFRCVETGKIYDSLAVAGIDSGTAANGISYALKGVYEKAGGFHWEYID